MRKQRTTVPAPSARRAYPSFGDLFTTPDVALDQLRTALHRAAAAGAAVVLLGCHGGEHATPTPPAILEPQHPAPPSPPIATAPPTPTPPPPTTLGGDPTAQLHEGDPCPLHDQGSVLTDATARTLPAAHRARLHSIGGIGVSGSSHMLGGGAMAIQAQPSAATVHVDSVQATGAVSTADVQRVVHGALGPVRACYEREVRNNPLVSGRIAVSFVVGANGRVTQSHVTDSTMGNSNVEACITAVARRAVFPPPSDGSLTNVTVAFTFQPPDE